ncbi:hypothetical protein EDE11_110136 [Methylomonas methanica]|nr:hypothetical protein EDE11_110136 [Methylomonas methanica]
MLCLRGYLPAAFDASLIALELFVDDFSFHVLPSQTLMSTFAEPIGTTATLSGPPEPDTARVNPDRADRMKSVWLLTNYTLAVPVLLALAVVYVAAKGLAEERNELQAIAREQSN